MCTAFCCGPPAVLALRNKIRGHYKIEGAIWKDICSLGWCFPCAVIQMINELKAH
jgi:Cys-rich protein (TIGR01571 family)